MICPLCGALANSGFRNLERQFYDCPICALAFVDPNSHLSPDLERARYEEHHNDVDDPRYRAFVSPLFEELTRRLGPTARGLDFGAGTGPVLATMLRESGYDICLYDPFFWPDESVLESQYDFIFAVEVVEHLVFPGKVFARLGSLLKDHGWLGVMTLLRQPKTDPRQWYYLRDPTHVCAYKKETFQWIKKHLGFDGVVFPNDRVIMLQKSEQVSSGDTESGF